MKVCIRSRFAVGAIVGFAATSAFVLLWPVLRPLFIYTPSPHYITARKLRRLHALAYVYKTIRGQFPSTVNWQSELIPFDDPDVQSSYVILDFMDAWGSPLRYRFPGVVNVETFDLYSTGPNGLDEGGKGDDIGNWPGRWSGSRELWLSQSKAGRSIAEDWERAKQENRDNLHEPR